MILSIIFFGFVLLLFGQDKKVENILDQMSQKYQKLNIFSVLFIYGVEGVNVRIIQVFKGNVMVKGLKFRLKMVGQEIFNNGKEIFIYVKEINEVNIMDFNFNNDFDFFFIKIYFIYKKGYKYVFKEEQKVGSQFYEVVELLLINVKLNVSKVQIIVNKKDKIVKSWKIWDKIGKRIVFKVEDFVLNVVVVDNVFIFDVRKYLGVEIVDLR